MTEGEIRAFVQRTLGLGTLPGVELTEDHLNDAVVAARLWHGMIIGQKRSTTVAISASTTEYAVPADCEYVVEVALDANAGINSWAWPLPSFNLNWLMPRNGRMGLTDITQSMQYMEQIQRTASADPDWVYDPARRLLIITPAGTDATMARIWYLTNNIDVTKLPLGEAFLVQEYALAHAMETLANIRTLFGEMPSAAGGFVMNGDLLSANAAEKKRDLTERLLRLQPPATFVLG